MHTDVESFYPLSPMQQGILFHTLLDPNDKLYFEQTFYDFAQGIDVEFLQQSWQLAVDRHPILRTTFHWSGLKEPVQAVHHHVTVKILQEDVRHLSQDQLDSWFADYLVQDRQRPYDLTQAPLMRLTLFRLSDVHYRLLWSRHHILLDGWSQGLVLKEVMAFYEDFSQARMPSKQLPPPYRDYIVWLRQENLAAAELFWRMYLEGVTPHTFPLRPAGSPDALHSSGYQAVRHSIDHETSQKLYGLARKHRLTVNTIVQGVWALILGYYTRANDVVFGGVTSGRGAPIDDIESMVGLFINTLPVRASIDPEMKFITWLEVLQGQQVQTRQYEYTPLAHIQRWANLMHGTQLFESILVFENYPEKAKGWELSGNTSFRDQFLVERTGYPLIMMVAAGRSMMFRLTFEQQRFDQTTIRQMLDSVESIIEALVSQPDIDIRDVPFINEETSQRLLTQWNMTAMAFPQEQTILGVFLDHVRHSPHASAVLSTDFSLTYDEVFVQSVRLGRALIRLGIRCDIPVGVCLPPSPELLIAILAIFMAKGVYLPLDQGLPPERLEFILDDSQAPLVITRPEWQERFASQNCQAITVAGAGDAAEAGHDLPSAPHPQSGAYIIYTSGSTGNPKGVVVNHDSLANYLNWVAKTLFQDDVEWIPVLSRITFDASLKQLLGPLMGGKAVWMLPDSARQNPAELINHLIGKQRVALNCVPAFWQTILDTLEPSELDVLATKLKTLLLGGEQLSPGLLHRSQQRFPKLKIWNLYGPTEATSNATAADLGSAQEVSIGLPVANSQAYVLDARLRPAPINVAGELYLSGVNLARAYLNSPALTAERFLPHPFLPGQRIYRTGDVARRLPGGNLELMGRIDRQIKLRGFRVELGEIEHALTRHPGVREAAVIVRGHSPDNQQLVAYCSFHDQTATSGELRGYLQRSLPDYMVPNAFMFLDLLPRTSHGKLDLRALPEPIHEPSPGNAYVAPTTMTELEMAEIWMQVLNIQTIGIHDSFFEAGGHSLLAIQLISKINSAFKTNLTLGVLYGAPTIDGILTSITQHQAGNADLEVLATLLEYLEQDSDTAVNRNVHQPGAMG